MSDQLRYLTKCRFCQKAFDAPALAVPIIGEPPHANVQRMEQAFAKHLMEKHPTEWGQLVGVASLFSRVLLLRLFETQDPALLRAEDISRFQVHQMTRKNAPPDDDWLRNGPASINGDPVIDGKALQALMSLRDYLIEANFTAEHQVDSPVETLSQ